MNYFVILLSTIIIEFFVYLIFIREKVWKIFLYSLLINSVTNPIMNFLYGINFNLYILEIGVFIIEIFLIKFLFKINYKKAILISLIANLLSFILGLIIF